MKKFLLLALFAVASLTMSAQLVTSSKYTVEEKKSSGWTGLRLSYDPISVSTDGADESMNFNGISLAWVKGISVSSSVPLFIETGVGLTYAMYSESEELYDEEYKLSMNLLTMQVPINFGYKYSFNESLSIFPYVGIVLRGNLLGNVKEEYDGDEEDDWSVFSSDDMGEDNTWNRFNVGWHVGVGLNYSKLHVGLSYGTDFNEIAEKTKVSTLSVKLGINF